MTTIPLSVVSEGAAHDLSITVDGDAVSIDQALSSLGVGVPDDLDRSAPATDVLVPGAVMGLAPRMPDEPGVVEVSVVAGLDAGHQIQLGAGNFRVGVVGDRRWGLQIHGSTLEPVPWHRSGASHEVVAGTGGSLAIGVPTDCESGGPGILYRPPRPPSGACVGLPDSPAPLPDIARPAALSWAALLAPVPIAVLMAVFFRPIFALFAALGPVFALARWAESRRSYRRACAARAEELAERAALRSVERRLFAERIASHRWSVHPHVAALSARARNHSVRLWERRPDSDEYLHVTLGIGPDTVTPESEQRYETGQRYETEQSYEKSDESGSLAQADQSIPIRPVPHVVDLDTGQGLGVFGERSSTLAIARSVVLQLATLHGPADLVFELICAPDREPVWDWLKWLPHLTDGTNDPGDDSARPVVCLIVDDPDADVTARYRTLADQDNQVRVIAIAASVTGLPARCDTLVGVDDYCHISGPGSPGDRQICPTGVSLDTACSWARSLAAVIDPEAAVATHTGRGEQQLAHLVGFVDAPSLRSRWNVRDPAAAPTAVIGTARDEPFRVDLVADGPHALVGGTTGAGKSELLRTLVMALAIDAPPDQLNFVLFDFKGGGAFDVCASLPHVVGVVTDLDEPLVSRAIDSLRIELHQREERLRARHASTFEQAADEFPRLVVVIDEFAVLATEYPDLMRSLIDMAARGRSLGMHLVLATQRPSGVVDQKIRANTNLRIALRMQDPHDSHDLLGIGDAALIDRRRPGRAIVRIGGDRPVTVQVAHAAAPERARSGCRVEPFVLRSKGSVSTDSPDPSADGRRQIDVLLSAIETATSGGSAARPLWTPPLPTRLAWGDLPRSNAREWPALGIADIVEQQEHRPWVWHPDRAGLALFSASAQVAASLLRSVAIALAMTLPPDDLHLYVFDGGARATASIAELPHVGALVGSDELDRIDRTLRVFERSLADRRAPTRAGSSSSTGTTQPQMVLLIDNIAAVLHAHSETTRLEVIERLESLARDGRALGLSMVVTARSVRDVPHRLSQHLATRLIGELADPAGALMLGLRPNDLVRIQDMQVVDAATGHLVVLADPPDPSLMPDFAGPVEGRSRTPTPVAVLPDYVPVTELSAASMAGSTVRLPMGLSLDEVEPVVFELGRGEHALVIGPPGSGRTSVLQLIACQLERSQIDSPPLVVMLDQPDTDQLTSIGQVTGPTIVLVDDAWRLDDDASQVLRQLSQAADPNLSLIVATSPEHVRGIRSPVSHIRSGGLGVILHGQPTDGDLLRAAIQPLPRAGLVPGRAHVCAGGRTTAVQMAVRPTARDRGA